MRLSWSTCALSGQRGILEQGGHDRVRLGLPRGNPLLLQYMAGSLHIWVPIRTGPTPAHETAGSTGRMNITWYQGWITLVHPDPGDGWLHSAFPILLPVVQVVPRYTQKEAALEQDAFYRAIQCT